MQHDNPFLLFAWQRPFLPDLKNYILEQTGGYPENALIIVPNQRPWLYFAQCFQDSSKTVVLPKMLPFANFVFDWRREAVPKPVVLANALDQTALLKECVHLVAKEEPVLAARFESMDMATFVPWGMRLASLLEDIFTQGLNPTGLAVTEGEVDPYVEALLAALGKIGNAYVKLLEERSITTPGLNCSIAAACAGQIPAAFMPTEQWLVLIAGFSVLNGAQKKLFHSLWQNGARICLHADPMLLEGQNYDPACEALARWQRDWMSGFELVTPLSDNKPEYSFFAAYDSHSQLLELARDLPQAENASTAIVLPNPELLLPVLHHLADKDVNISMGYPITRTPVHSLIAEIFKMYLRKRPEGKFYWRDLLKLLQHPLLSILKTPAGISLRPALRQLAGLARSQNKFVSLPALQEAAAANLSPDEAEFMNLVLKTVITNIAAVSSTDMLADALAGICNLLSDNGSKALSFFPLNAEAMNSMSDSVLPVLKQNIMAREPLGLATLHNLLEMLLAQEAIPFEAYPLVGTQIIGLLETRLLQFDNVFILDASDDLLPGAKAEDSLLPDNLRPLLGLSSSRSRNDIVAYNIARLCHCAKNAHFYWSEGTALSDLAQGQRFRSRFVEQLIWRLEREQGSLLEVGDGPLKAAVSRASLARAKPRPLARTASLDQLVQQRLQQPVSTAFLNDLLACPLKFAYKRLLRLNPLAEVSEEDDPMAVGLCVHDVLRNLLEPYQKSCANLADFDLLATLAEDVRQELDREIIKLKDQLPVDAYLHFEIAGKQLLSAYFSKCAKNLEKALAKAPNGKYGHTVLALEEPLAVTLNVAGKTYKLDGKLDRIDNRNGEIVVLDYKTGSAKDLDSSIWQNGEFFTKVQEALEDDAVFAKTGEELFSELRETFNDFQLPVYMLLSAGKPGLKADNAAYIYLRSAEEVSLLADDADLEQARTHFELAVAFLLKYLETTPVFAPSRENCDDCEYSGVCATARI